MDNTIGLDTARKGRYFILSKGAYDKGLQTAYAAVETRTHVDTEKLIAVHIFVMALPYSGYFYCEGFFDERMDSWLTVHMHGFEFFGGVPDR